MMPANSIKVQEADGAGSSGTFTIDNIAATSRLNKQRRGAQAGEVKMHCELQ